MDQTSNGTAPAVSVCIPLYMKERFVAETIQSILDQTFEDFELVILHNASPDRSGEIAASFDDPRIRLVHNEETLPGPDNVVKLISLARSPLIKVVAADDILLPSVLEKQVAVMTENPDVALVSCRQNMIGEHSETIYPDRSLRSADLLGKQGRTTVVRRVIRHGGNPVGAYVNMLFRRTAYDAAGGMPDVPWIAQDLGLALELLHHGNFYGMEESLVGFRIASGSASASDGSAGIADQVQYIEDLRRDNPGIVRRSDVAYSSLRMPVMRLRHQLIIAAAGPKNSVRTKAATRVLAMSRAAS